MTPQFESHNCMQMPKLHTLLLFAISSSILASCGQGSDTAERLYQQARNDEAANNLKNAELEYLQCIAACEETKSQYFQIAALNRLTELEPKLNNHSKAKTFMNQAATLAEKPDDIQPGVESKELAKEKHLALMRLASWKFEDGNFLSSRKLFAEAAALEPILKIDPNLESSAVAHIKMVESRAGTEHNEVAQRIGNHVSFAELRGAEAKKRADNRHKLIENLIAQTNVYKLKGGDELGRKMLSSLDQVRTSYGTRDEQYRLLFENVASAFLYKHQVVSYRQLVEKDMQEFSAFKDEDLTLAKADAMENAEFYARDLLLMAQLYNHSYQWKEMLDVTKRARQLADKVIRHDSIHDYNANMYLATALEFTDNRKDALNYRQRALEQFQKLFPSKPHALAEHYFQLAQDLEVANHSKESEEAFKRALSLQSRDREQGDLQGTLHAYSDILFKQQKYAEARKYSLEELPLRIKENNPITLVDCYVNIAKSSTASHPKEAMEYFRLARDVMRKHPEVQFHEHEANLLKAAVLEEQFQNHKTALKNLDEALARLHKKKHRTPLTAGILNTQATILNGLGETKKEEAARKEAIEICRELKPRQIDPLASTLVQAGNSSAKRKMYAEAEQFYEEALSTLAETSDSALMHYKLSAQAGLATTLALMNKKIDKAKSLQASLLNSYKTSYTSIPNENIAMNIYVARLCLALKDKNNCQKVLDEAESIYQHNKQTTKSFKTVIDSEKQKLSMIP